MQEQKIPFEIKHKTPSLKTAQTLKEAVLIKQKFSSLDEMMSELTTSESKSKK
ncbi:hypothetical protein [Proteus columbae]|uniref:hypothetical protein n=1 Tax=Proteus columbae TaxID=1987580 RepID=UPI00288BECD2|nr:hypothetical protein [Proteus columbae]